jgi:RNA polymerase primary sigma factor
MTQPAATAKVRVPAALLKYGDRAARQLLSAGRRRGYVTFDELNEMLPADEVSAAEIEAVFEALCGLGIEVSES